MRESLNGAVFTRREHTIGVAVLCEVQAVTTSSPEAVQQPCVAGREGVTGRPVHDLEPVLGEATTATLMLGDEQEIRAADVWRWMAEACEVPVEQVTRRFVGVHAVFGLLLAELEVDEQGRPDGRWRDARD